MIEAPPPPPPPPDPSESSVDAKPKNAKRKRQTPAQLAARVSRACDRCRGRKYKCDGGHPCSSCSGNGLPCTYDPVFRRRGLPEGYVRGLERLLGLAMSRDPTFEELVVSIANKGQEEDFEIPSPDGGWNLEKDGETLHDSWKKSLVSSQVEGLIPILESLERRGLKRRRVASQSFSESSRTIKGDTEIQQPGAPISQDFDPLSLPNYGTVEDPIASPTPHPELPNNSHMALPHVRNNSVSKTPEQLAFEAAVPSHLPERAGRLLDAYFTFTHCWLPFIDRHDMIRLSYRYPTISGGLSLGSAGTGEIAALWALLAYTDCPTLEWQDTQDGSRSHEITTKQLYLAARALIPPETMNFELGHVQALLLLVLYNMRYATLDAGWILLGQATRIAIVLGLNKPGQAVALSDQPRKSGGRHLHVFLACFALDTFLSARLNRAPHLRKQDLAHAGALIEDGPEEWGPWTDSQASGPSSMHYCNPSFIASTFNRLIETLIILNETICDTSLGLEWEQRYSVLRTRLAESSAKIKSNSQSRGSRTLPHHAVLRLIQLSTLAVLRLHSTSHGRTKPTPRGGPTLSAQLTSQLQQCLDVFGAPQYPPLLGFPALLALKEDEAFNTDFTSDHTHWKKDLLGIAIKLEVRNSGFREIQNAVALSEHSTFRGSGSQANQKEMVSQDGFATDSSINTPSFWEAVGQEKSPFTKPKREHIPNNLPTPTSQSSLLPFPHTGTSSATATPIETPGQLLGGGEFGDIGPFETATAIITEDSPSHAPSSVRSATFQAATRKVSPRVGSRQIHGSPPGDGDAAFLSLAHLDTTQWSNNWEDGLAELGFTSDSMFREFCNDPDRLFNGDAT